MIGDRDRLTATIELPTLSVLNQGLTSVCNDTMIDCLGSPLFPLSKKNEPSRANPRTQALISNGALGECSYTGLRPAVEGMTDLLLKVFDGESALSQIMLCAAMLQVHLRIPITGAPSSKASNHSWGAAIDFHLNGERTPKDAG